MSDKKSSKMIYCDGPANGAFPVKNIHHKGLHYMIVDSEAKTPSGFRDTMVKGKAKKPTKAELAAIKEAEEEEELAAMEAAELAAKEG